MNRRLGVTTTAIAATAMILAMTTSASASVTQLHTIDGWASYSQGGAELAVRIDVTDPHGGDAALRIDFSSPRAGGVYGGIAQSVPVPPSTGYTVSGWAKGDGIQGPEANRFVLDELWSEQ